MAILPRSARLACWLNGWLAGRVSADDAVAGVARIGSRLWVSGFDDVTTAAQLLAVVRRGGLSRAILAMPVPGNLMGLGGPPMFNADALDTGEAVILEGMALGLIPSDTGEWSTAPADPPTYLPDVASADRALKEALIGAASALMELDVASWSPDAADEVMNIRRPLRFDESSALPNPTCCRLVATAVRCLRIIDVAMRDEGGAATAGEAAKRRGALVPLRDASHGALVAACSSLSGR